MDGARDETADFLGDFLGQKGVCFIGGRDEHSQNLVKSSKFDLRKNKPESQPINP
jgi:hypothetical protein